MTSSTNTDARQTAQLILVGVVEVQELLARRITRERVEALTYGDDFPVPFGELAAGNVWLREDVEAWIAAHDDYLAALLKPDR